MSGLDTAFWGPRGGGGSVSSAFFIYFLWLFSLSLKNAFKTAGRNPETAPFLKSAGFSEKKNAPIDSVLALSKK